MLLVCRDWPLSMRTSCRTASCYLLKEHLPWPNKQIYISFFHTCAGTPETGLPLHGKPSLTLVSSGSSCLSLPGIRKRTPGFWGGGNLGPVKHRKHEPDDSNVAVDANHAGIGLRHTGTQNRAQKHTTCASRHGSRLGSEGPAHLLKGPASSSQHFIAYSPCDPLCRRLQIAGIAGELRWLRARKRVRAVGVQVGHAVAHLEKSSVLSLHAA